METNKKISSLIELNQKYPSIPNSIKVKSEIETKKVPIEKVEFILKENNQKIIPKKKIIKHIYKEKENIMNLISKELKEFKKPKKIVNQKDDIIYPSEKKIFSIRKKYINDRNFKENINTSFKRIFPLTYKNIQNLNKEKQLMHKSLSNPQFNYSQEMNMESNFMKLSKEANIYTANANYIQNKKILLFDKFNYDNNQYIPDRAKLFDMTRMPKMPKKHSFIYKTTKFRAGHLINGDNKTYDFGKNNNGLNNTSLIELYLKKESDYNKKGINGNDNNKNLRYKNCENSITPYSYIDNNYQKKKRHPPSDTFYKELMSKKNETYEQYFKNIDNEKEKEKEREKEKEIINTEEYFESIGNKNDIKDNEEQGFLMPYYKKVAKEKKPEVKRLYYKQIL